MSYDLYSGVLKMMDGFDGPATYGPNFTYEHEHPKLVELCDSYGIRRIAGGGGELSQALNLLNWLSSNTYHASSFDNSIAFNALDLLEYTFKQSIEKGVNCRALAKILCECCLSVGLKARTLYVMPFNPYDEDNHVVTIVFVHELDKWIMLDPSYNAYMKDENGAILSPWEARKIISLQSYIKLNDEYNYNGDYTGERSGEPPKYYIEYMAKNLFWFFCAEKSSFGADHGDTKEVLSLAPPGYDVKKFFISNIEYRIKKYGKREGLLKWLANAKQEEAVYISFEDFIARP